MAGVLSGVWVELRFLNREGEGKEEVVEGR